MAEVALAILNPVATTEIARVKPAERLRDLNNKRIGLFWNKKARGDVALRKVEAVLKQKFNQIQFTWFEKETGVALVPEQLKFLKHLGNDAIISTTGD